MREANAKVPPQGPQHPPHRHLVWALRLPLCSLLSKAGEQAHCSPAMLRVSEVSPKPDLGGETGLAFP